MPARDSNLFFDQVVIVEQPFSRGDDVAFLLNGFEHQFVGFAQDVLVSRQSSKQAVRPVVRINLVPGRQRLSVLFQLSRAEQLRSQWKIVSKFAKESIDPDSCLQTFDPLANRFAA